MSFPTGRPLEHLKGYVTTLAAIAHKSPAELERALGFSEDSLAGGYLLYELAEPVGLADLEWADRTTYSDGWHYDPTIGEYVKRLDELRAHFGKATNYDEARTDARIRRVLEGKLAQLKEGRVVKVVPKGARPTSYPDSDDRGVAQWRLLTLKAFRLIADVGPGGRAPQ